MEKRHSLSGVVYHNRMVDAHLASKDRSEDIETLTQEKRAALTPEQWLLLAILEDAVAVLMRGPGKDRAYEEAQAWVRSDRTHPFSFVGICEVFDYNVPFWRERLLAIKPSGRRVVSMRPGLGSARPRVCANDDKPRRRVAYHPPRAVA